MTDELRVLQRARKLLESGWCQDMCAQDMQGREVYYDKESAKLFCTLGAVYRAASDLHAQGAAEQLAFKRLTHVLDLPPRDFDSLGQWNDDPHRTRDDVLALFDLAMG